VTQPLSLSQRAYEAIKRKIVTLELAPGSVIDETALQEELGLGRTPIREALKRLSLEKLVTILPRRGMFVTEIGIADLTRLYEVRIELEALAARLAARRGRPEHWQRMAAALSQIPTEPDHDVLIAIDEGCHQIMYQAADNAFLADMLNSLYALSLRLWYFALADIGDMHDTVMEHQIILEALQAGDEERAAALLSEHINTFQEEIQSAMVGAPPARRLDQATLAGMAPASA
jgi:DNA-binding GntR family transcriptional regulator